MGMLDRLKDLLSAPSSASELPDPERVRVATCALLLEVASADDEFSDVEREQIVAVLRTRFALSEAEAGELMAASEARRHQHYDLWHFTRPLNGACSPAEKQAIIEEVWRVVYADGKLEVHEDYVVHKLAKLLNLNHPQLIEAKLRAKNDG